MDVGSWLRNLGLGHLEAAFRDNSIDADILASLTSDDLRELGVPSVGHRRKLLDAISQLRSATFATGTRVASSPSQTAPTAKAPDIATERRPITVTFCDLGGRQASLRSSTRRTGATSSTPTSTKPRRQ